MSGYHKGADRNDCHDAFQKHGAVTDGQCVRFARDLLGRGAAADQGVEAGDGAAGYHGEEAGPEGLARKAKIGDVGGKGRYLAAVKAGAEDHANRADDDREIEEEGSEIVARLEQEPYRQRGSRKHVDAQEDVPEAGVMREDRLDPGPVASVDGAEGDDDEHHDRDGLEVDVEVIDAEAGHHRDRDVKAADEGHHRVCHKGERCHGDKDGYDKYQSKDSEAEEKLFAGLADPLFDNDADRVTVMADGSYQRAHIVRTAEEDAADHTPDQRGDPAENTGRKDRSRNGTRAGDG